MPPVRNVSAYAYGCGAACECHDALRDPSCGFGCSAQKNPGWSFRGRSDPDQEAGSVRLEIIRGSKQTQPLMQKFVRIVTRRTRKRWRTTAAALHLKRKMNIKWRVL